MTIFKAERSRVAEDLDRFLNSLRMKFGAEIDRYASPRGRVNYAFSRLEGLLPPCVW